jgi:hypothetical protein
MVTHFSGVGAGTAAPADLAALQALPASPARAIAGNALAALLEQGVTSVGPYAAVLADWYDAAVAPALAAATASDAALRAALREYVQWNTSVEALGVIFADLELVLGANGFALANRREAAAPQLVAGLQAGVARAKADCRSQQSLARAEDAFRWHLVADQLGLGTIEHGLDRERVLEDFCVEVRFEELDFPEAVAAGVPALLRLRVGYAFDGAPTRFDVGFGVVVTATGATPESALGLADADGRWQEPFTPAGDAPVVLDLFGCLQSSAHPALSLFNLCQRAFVVRGDLTVLPAMVALPAGAQQQFTAEMFGIPTAAVTWTATGGTITAGGLFTAGDEAGSFTVTATSSLDPSLRATAVVEVGTAGTVSLRERTCVAYASIEGSGGGPAPPSFNQRQEDEVDDAVPAPAVLGPFALANQVSDAHASATASGAASLSSAPTLDPASGALHRIDGTLAASGSAEVAIISAHPFGLATASGAGRAYCIWEFAVEEAAQPYELTADIGGASTRSRVRLQRLQPFGTVAVQNGPGLLATSGVLDPGRYQLTLEARAGAFAQEDDVLAGAEDATVTMALELAPAP